ncbi:MULTISPECIES: hypothetical protein [unclassified Streptomyces]|uniref:hypothetical protein n=1 Tax=unclassified Streptomyces TaxID=2593676 RepID=UPI002E12C87A|nr:hypothetical protein OG452_02755 [Streptomyces sp. NBC_01197]WSS52909.1 hypothetical protein OG708_32310 [Streptomyces sp. NBC_01180]
MVNAHNDDEDEFYSRDRPEHPVLPEDRPRGGQPKQPLQHRGPWTVAAIIVAVIVLIIVGVALFP